MSRGRRAFALRWRATSLNTSSPNALFLKSNQELTRPDLPKPRNSQNNFSAMKQSAQHRNGTQACTRVKSSAKLQRTTFKSYHQRVQSLTRKTRLVRAS